VREVDDLLSFSIAHKGLIMVGVPLALNLFVLAGLGYLLHQEDMQKLQEEKENAINQHADDVRRLLFGAGNAVLKYTLGRNETQFAKYNEVRKEIAENSDQLLRLESGDQAQTLSLQHILLLQNRLLKIYDAACSATHEGRNGMNVFKELQLSFELQVLSKVFIKEIDKFIAIESNRQSLESHGGWLLPLKTFLALSVVANIALSIYLALFFGRNFADRLKTMIDNTLRLASDEPLHPIVAGNDEISLLDGVYHEMASVLKQARRKERVFIDNAADIICTIDEKRKFADVSPASEVVWGYSPADLIGRSVAAVTANDDLSATFAQVQDHKSATAEMNFENRITHKDGRLIDMLWSTYWSNHERTYFCVAHDITASKAAQNLLKESEARISTIIENLPVGLLIHDGQGNIELTNKKAEEMLMVAGSELLHDNLSSHFFPRKEDSGEAPLSSPARKSFAAIEELSCRRGDGTTLPIELHMNDLYYQSQRKSLAIMVDVSERYQLENARNELVHMVSHDLRTPLNSVEAIMDLLVVGALGQLTAAETDMALESKQELRRLLALINGLLDLEKIQAGALELEREVNSTLFIANKAFDAVADLAKKSKILLSNHAQDCELLCDADRLIEVMVLFVMDAVRQNPRPAAISIFADQTEAFSQFKVVSSPSVSSLSVTSPGAPSPGAQASRLHLDTTGDADTRCDSPKKEAETGSSGSGLWLVICQGIVAAHKGTLEITISDADETVYAFKIPQPDFGEAESSDEASAAPAPAGG